MTSDEHHSPTEPDEATRTRVRKSAEAYRTISEVADDLHVPQHVLRFWETKFPRIKPLKRGGGRRYYRPDDVMLLRRIADLLYIQGYTIKGVQRLLKEGGGSLHDEIPPASEEERAAAAAERGQSMPLPGMKPLGSEFPELPITDHRPAAPQQRSLAASEPSALVRARQSNTALRAALGAALEALESLRAGLTE